MLERGKLVEEEMNRNPLPVLDSPCTTCPYRKDTPPGIWHEDEYAKLKTYDDAYNPALAMFLCHQSGQIGQETLCRGWLTVHKHSVAVRLAIMTGQTTVDDVHATVKEKLYKNGTEACNAGMRGVKRPGAKARKAITRLRKQKGIKDG